jgi:hypothetical protein
MVLTSVLSDECVSDNEPGIFDGEGLGYGHTPGVTAARPRAIPLRRRGRSPTPERAALNFFAPSLAGPGDQDESDEYDERAGRHRDGLLCVAMSAPPPEDRLCAGSVMVNEPFPQSFSASWWRVGGERWPGWRSFGELAGFKMTMTATA